VIIPDEIFLWQPAILPESPLAPACSNDRGLPDIYIVHKFSLVRMDHLSLLYHDFGLNKKFGCF
jgi:hypothetical protein